MAHFRLTTCGSSSTQRIFAITIVLGLPGRRKSNYQILNTKCSLSLAPLPLAVGLALRQSELPCRLLQGGFFFDLTSVHQLSDPLPNLLGTTLRMRCIFSLANQ